MCRRSAIVDFLNLFKGCIELDRFAVMHRAKNIQGLIDLDMTPAQRSGEMSSSSRVAVSGRKAKMTMGVIARAGIISVMAAAWEPVIS